jgi:hypothetical protein
MIAGGLSLVTSARDMYAILNNKESWRFVLRAVGRAHHCPAMIIRSVTGMITSRKVSAQASCWGLARRDVLRSEAVEPHSVPEQNSCVVSLFIKWAPL